MDVTFIEKQLYYSKTNIQEENEIQEYQFWELKLMFEPPTLKSIMLEPRMLEPKTIHSNPSPVPYTTPTPHTTESE